MTLLRTASSAVLSTICSFLLASAGGCGSDAVGVDACRDIESARCEAGKPCGFVDDVDECKRFYRDHCLHGLRAGKQPGDIQVDACIKSIKLAGECARTGAAHLLDCPTPVTLNSSLATPCEVVQFPERIGECEFLLAPIDAGLPVKDTGAEASTDAASEAAADAPEGG